jgi:hypothetical protein
MRVAILEINAAVRRVRGLLGSSLSRLMALEHLCYHNETQVLSLLDVIRISGFRPVSDVIDTREQYGI